MKETQSADATPRSPHRKYAGKDASTRKAERRDKLLVAAVALIGDKGFAATTIDDICREAGLTKRYFYESFDRREVLLTKAFESVTRELLQRIAKAAAPHAQDARALVRTGVHETFAFMA
ncbi:MAG: TetR/AcrR family transcriptional regulator, partial [Algiphilus sp.]